MNNQLPPLRIGDLELKIPIFQGAMGVQVSTASLASAVATYGGAGTMASVGLGFGNQENETHFVKASRDGLRQEIRKARQLTQGVIGVNILVAVSNYEDLARTAAQEGIDYIVSGAGLPMKLPEYVQGASSKLIPIVSSSRAFDLILRTWRKRYNRIPDALIVEGPLAGGHLGFTFEMLRFPEKQKLEKIVCEVLKIVRGYEKELKVSIPVIAAGGIFTGKDIAHFIGLGVDAVQMASRFVVTKECSVADAFKELYIQAKAEDIVLIKSPVGMPGRAIRTPFIDQVRSGYRIPFTCHYQCLKTCNPKTAPYCIAKALYNAARGKLEQAVVFSGTNVARIEEHTTVKKLMDNLTDEAVEALREEYLMCL